MRVPLARITLLVGDDIQFDGTAKNVWLSIKTPIATEHGMVVLRPGAHLVGARTNGDSVVGSLVMYANDVLAGEDKDPDERIDGVSVPCSALTLDWAGDGWPEDLLPEDPSAASQPLEGWIFWQNRTRATIRSAPRLGAPALRLAAQDLELLQVDVLGDWLRVEETGEYAYAIGWVRRSDVVRLRDDLYGGRDYVCFGDHDEEFEFIGGSAALRKGLYSGPVQVRVGTTLYREPGKGPWAVMSADRAETVGDSQVANDPFQASYVEGDAWIALTAIPGIDGYKWAVYVPAESIVRPPGSASH